MYVANEISGSASVRLLRLTRQLACAVQNTSNSSVVITAHACSTLKVHAQCAQGMCSLELLYWYWDCRLCCTTPYLLTPKLQSLILCQYWFKECSQNYSIYNRQHAGISLLIYKDWVWSWISWLCATLVYSVELEGVASMVHYALILCQLHVSCARWWCWSPSNLWSKNYQTQWTFGMVAFHLYAVSGS